MSELNFLPPPEPRNVIGDWTIRIGVACAFVVIGLDKFSPTGEWIDLFRRIGAGDWFRHFTGVVEILGGLLVLIPRTALIGFALLGATMLSAAIILAFHPP
jgi:putative oxidoreductase